MATSYTACNRALDREDHEKLKNERDTLRKIFETLKRKDATQVIQVAELEKQLANALKEVEEVRAAAHGMEANSQLQLNSLRIDFDDLQKAFDVLKHKGSTQTSQVKGCERLVTRTQKELAEARATAQETEACLRHTIATLHRRLGTRAASTQSPGVVDAKTALSHQSNTASGDWKLFLVEVEDGLAAIRTTLGLKDKAIETLHEENASLRQGKNDLRNACQNLKRKYSLCETSTDRDPGEVDKKMRFDSPLEHRPAQTTGHSSCDSSVSNNSTTPTVAPDTNSSTDQPATQNHQGYDVSDQHALAWLDQNIA